MAVFMAFNWIDMGKSLMTAVKDGISSLKGQITTKAGEIGNAIKTKIAEFPAKLKTEGANMISRLGEGITSKISNARTAISNIGNAIKTKISELPAQMKTIGGDIVRGIWSGISDKVSWIISMIGGFKDRVVNAIKEKFGINSPSKVMRDKVGRWIPPGIGEGVEESMPDLEKQLNRDLDGLAASVQANVNADVNRRIIVQTSPSGSSPKQGGGKIIHIDYHPEQKFDGPVSLRDMDEHNRRSARGMEKVIANA